MLWKNIYNVSTKFLPGLVSKSAGGDTQAKLSIRIASSLCGVLEKYERTKVLEGPLRDYPDDAKFMDGPESILWTKCDAGGTKKIRCIKLLIPQFE